jgi:cellulose synthase/poly-beta-1,6-N-acetylglucosamine synthase-like glycosyltransferase
VPLLATLLLAALALVAVPTVLYLFGMTLLSGQPRRPPHSGRSCRFDVIVPAHNETLVIERVLASLQLLDWPADRLRVLVVADNCSDDTAAKARQMGALVLERQDPVNRGKGYALKHAFACSAADGLADAVVVIDADSVVSPNLLEACAARIALGEQAVQVHYGIQNPMASWRTRLLTIAKGSFHIVRSRARERLRLSCGIRGNGWCLSHALLRAVPYECFSLTEDVEFGGVLGLAGHRVAYADEAHADAEMTTNAKVASTQRARWESGRFELMRLQLPTLLRAAAGGSRLCLDLALDLLVLPLTYVALAAALLLLGGLGGHALGLVGLAWAWLGVATAALLALHVARGWWLSGVGLRGALDLACVPVFIAWRLVVALKPKPRDWVRTDREGN